MKKIEFKKTVLEIFDLLYNNGLFENISDEQIEDLEKKSEEILVKRYKTEYYIIERRINLETVNANCFISSSINDVIKWINDNKDFDEVTNWYWCVIKIKLNDPIGGELYKIFDYNGNELKSQPIN